MFIRVKIRDTVYEIHEGTFASSPELTPKMFLNRAEIRSFYRSCLNQNNGIENQLEYLLKTHNHLEEAFIEAVDQWQITVSTRNEMPLYPFVQPAKSVIPPVGHLQPISSQDKMEQPASEQPTSKSLKDAAQKIAPGLAAGALVGTSQTQKTAENWVELELVDQDNQPIPNEEFIVIDAFTRNTVTQGTLEANGTAYVALPKNTAHVEVMYPDVEDVLPDDYFIQPGESNQDYASRIWKIFTKHRLDKNFTESQRIISAVKQEAGLSDPLDFNNPTQADADYLAQIQNLKPGAWQHPAMEKTGEEVSSPPVNPTLFMGPGYQEYYCRNPKDHGLAFKTRERLQEAYVLNETHLKMERELGQTIRHARAHADPWNVLRDNPDVIVDAIGMSAVGRGIGGSSIPVKPKGTATAPRRRQTGRNISQPKSPVRDRGKSKSTIKTKTNKHKDFSFDQQFGNLRQPYGGLKDFEHSKGKIISNPELQIIKPGDKAAPLVKGKRYIWAIDKNGNLRIGVEHEVSPGKRLGHPSLVGKDGARAGGEIKLNSETKEWRINDRSGRYSRGRTKEEKANILENTQKLFKYAGLNVGVKK